jgi:hypothetical protein
MEDDLRQWREERAEEIEETAALIADDSPGLMTPSRWAVVEAAEWLGYEFAPGGDPLTLAEGDDDRAWAEIHVRAHEMLSD